jgi:hypothetical protein
MAPGWFQARPLPHPAGVLGAATAAAHHVMVTLPDAPFETGAANHSHAETGLARFLHYSLVSAGTSVDHDVTIVPPFLNQSRIRSI